MRNVERANRSKSPSIDTACQHFPNTAEECSDSIPGPVEIQGMLQLPESFQIQGALDIQGKESPHRAQEPIQVSISIQGSPAEPDPSNARLSHLGRHGPARERASKGRIGVTPRACGRVCEQNSGARARKRADAGNS
ncbi:hypothetical protein MTO96_012179 [Rhipicephalus appendiculatus]